MMEQRPPGDRGIVTLRVQGWMLPQPTAAGSSEQPPAVYLSDLLVKARVLLNKELFGEESTVTWDPSQVDLAADGFQFSRPAKQSFDAKIELHLVPWSDTAKRTATQKLESLTAMRRVGKLLPVRARRAGHRHTSPSVLNAQWPLIRAPRRQIVKQAYADLQTIVVAVWDYTLAMGLMRTDGEKNYIYCNEELKRIFGEEQGRFLVAELRARVEEALPTADSSTVVSLDYRVGVDEAEVRNLTPGELREGIPPSSDHAQSCFLHPCPCCYEYHGAPRLLWAPLPCDRQRR
jgi:hypothetical protein